MNIVVIEVLLTNCLDQDVRLQKGQLIVMAKLLESSVIMMIVTKAK